jgi:hypothetical protein
MGMRMPDEFKELLRHVQEIGRKGIFSEEVK